MTVGSEQKSGKGIYRITGTRKTVTFVKPLNDKNTSFNVPASVKLADGRYKVTAIDKNAFKNNRKLKKVTIGSNVKKIEKNAFAGCSKLKTVNMKKATGITSIGSKAFSKIDAKAKVTVPAKKLSKYKKMLKKAGLPKKATVKK